MKTDIDRARAVKAKVLRRLGRRDWLRGVGIARDAEGFFVQVNIDRDRPEARQIPHLVDGVRVKTDVVGDLHLQPRGGYSYLVDDKRLAQGSKPPVGVELPFDVIVLAAYEYQVDMPGFEVMHVPLDDDFEEPVTPTDQKRIHDAARKVAQHVRARRRVLVTCHHGRNRSGVIAGLALVKLGVPGREAFRLIRHLRDGLTNPHFRRMVVGS